MCFQHLRGLFITGHNHWHSDPQTPHSRLVPDHTQGLWHSGKVDRGFSSWEDKTQNKTKTGDLGQHSRCLAITISIVGRWLVSDGDGQGSEGTGFASLSNLWFSSNTFALQPQKVWGLGEKNAIRICLV